jgi:hypothetical protein
MKILILKCPLFIAKFGRPAGLLAGSAPRQAWVSSGALPRIGVSAIVVVHLLLLVA